MAFEWRFDFALKTAAPVSARELFTRTAIRLAVNALEFYVAARLRRPCLDRFAVFAKASHIFIENAEKTSGRAYPGLSV